MTIAEAQQSQNRMATLISNAYATDKACYNFCCSYMQYTAHILYIGHMVFTSLPSAKLEC